MITNMMKVYFTSKKRNVSNNNIDKENLKVDGISTEVDYFLGGYRANDISI